MPTVDDRSRGSVLMLMPAAVLILVILGGITFDYAHLYLAKRELTSLAEGAANDAVTYGLDQASVHRGDGYALDPERVTAAVDASISTHSADLHLEGPPKVVMLGPTEVRVTITARIDYVFARALPAASDGETVTVT